MSKSSVINHKEKRINAISKKANVMMLCILSVFALLCVLPVLLVVVVSFSSEQSIFQNGYSFFPTQLSLNAYRFFLRLGDQIIRSYGITIFVTIVGTLFSLAVTTMLSYVLSRPDYRYGKILTFLLLFTMLFNGGLVPSYMVNTQLLGLRDSVWALIFPMSLNAFYVIVLRTFFKSIPMEIIEAAHIDGAGEFTCFVRIIMPNLKPVLYTITVLSFLNTFKAFREAYLVAGSYPDESMYLLQHLFNNWFTNLDFDKMAAAAVILGFILFAVILLLQKLWDEGE